MNHQIKLIDFGAACDLCTGINFNPEYGMLDPRYAGEGGWVGPFAILLVFICFSCKETCNRARWAGGWGGNKVVGAGCGIHFTPSMACWTRASTTGFEFRAGWQCSVAWVCLWACRVHAVLVGLNCCGGWSMGRMQCGRGGSTQHTSLHSTCPASPPAVGGAQELPAPCLPAPARPLTPPCPMPSTPYVPLQPRRSW